MEFIQLRQIFFQKNLLTFALEILSPFIILPYCTNMYAANKLYDKVAINFNTMARLCFEEKLVVFCFLASISDGYHASLQLICSRMFSMHIFDCQLSKRELLQSSLTLQLNFSVFLSAGSSKENKYLSHQKIIRFYFGVIWKMGNVYSSFLVYMFDVFTDYLIIIEWFELGRLEKETADNNIVDSTIMGYCAVSVLISHKLSSFIAFWTREKSIARCILVLRDSLIFQEIYATHLNIVNEIKKKFILAYSASYTNSNTLNGTNSTNNGKLKDEIETTSFKFVRHLEAVFESIPQAVVQTVFLMRTEWKFDTTGSVNSESDGFSVKFFVVTIIQSIISMSNAILRNDHAEMTLPKWKAHKRRFPPTKECFKHSIWRFSEILYRIGLLSLVWTVCCFLFSLVIENGFDILLRLHTMILLPSELIYKYEISKDDTFNASNCCKCEFDTDYSLRWYEEIFHFIYRLFKNFIYCIYLVLDWLLCIFCYYQQCICFTILRIGSEKESIYLSNSCEECKVYSIVCKSREQFHYFAPTARIGVSFVEFMVLLFDGIYGDNGQRLFYLISINHGLIVFILSIITFIIYTQYLKLFPNFSLPKFVSARKSKDGLAFNAELEELNKLDNNNNNNNGIELFTSETVYYALSNVQYHVVDWIQNEKRIDLIRKIQNERKCLLFNSEKYVVDGTDGI